MASWRSGYAGDGKSLKPRFDPEARPPKIPSRKTCSGVRQTHPFAFGMKGAAKRVLWKELELARSDFPRHSRSYSVA